MFNGTRQLDCVAETTNMSVSWSYKKDQGLLKWRSIGYPEHCGFDTPVVAELPVCLAGSISNPPAVMGIVYRVIATHVVL